jgi:peroxiredoxin
LLDFEVLSDIGNKVGKKYGIVFELPDEVAVIYDQHIQLEKYNQDKSNELPMPVTYIIDQNGVIRYAFIDADYTRRAEPNEIITVLTEM